MIARALPLALALVALAPAARAQSSAAESPWSATIEVGPRWNHDVSYTAFRNGTAAPAAAGLAFGRDLAHLGPWLTLGFEVGWTNEGTQTRVRDDFATSLITNRLQGGLLARFELSRFITPYVRVVAGAAHLAATVDGTSGSSLSGDAWAPQGSAGAGVMFTSGRWFRGLGWARGKLALGIEGGYQYTLPTRLDVAVPVPQDEAAAADRLPHQAVSLGTLNASAAYLRVTFNLRF